MIDHSAFGVIYYDEHYMPPKRKNRTNDFCGARPTSGTKLAYEYAVKKKLRLSNVAIVIK